MSSGFSNICMRSTSIRCRWAIKLTTIILGLIAAACVSREPMPPQSVVEDYKVKGIAAPIPSGTEHYCWEEPIVVFEQNGPRVDEEGHWYHPDYQAVREVRQGRWRPCSAEKERQSSHK